MTTYFHNLPRSFLVMALVMALGFSSAHAAALVNGNHFISSRNFPSAYVCLSADNSSNGTVVFGRPCLPNFSQAWNWDVFEIQGLGTSTGDDGVHRKCLDVRGGGTADGTPVQIFECNGTGAQQWIYTGTGTIFNLRSGKCLDLKTVNRFGFNEFQAVIKTCNTVQNWVVQ
ncbi:ricin-type beta-trefoil lectin domain protein [Methyloterricola oryzae]|uniref:ricin-type beta-trefoil lectin domain protein n=1 Tax=Methyloterricola oryzae TaxID=1495050 RepID=UPI0005EBAA84|nr:ricin-type beta-trefoil lectin domain protein [Methyloterricola oryzae]